jgi:phage baseplate assembly protein W|tara:strand:- start:27422 stop:27886 length:465 start_codon:yes stop_codon:yes gene_type:complete
MPNPKYGISFPFKDSQEGLFLHMNGLPEDEVRSNLIHLVLSVKGSRYFLPEFGTNLMKHIFEPLDTGTRTSIDIEIRDAVKQFIPNLNITDVEIKSAEDLRDEDTQEEDPTRDQKTFSFSDKKHGVNEYTLRVRIDYSIGSGVFEARDFVIINL